jgi:putative flavoprotein involved in K+ transport
MMPESATARPAPPGEPTERFDTVIVGGGQAGLSVGYHLARLGQSFAILDLHHRIGDNWRERYDSLRLFSPAKYDALPGMPFPAARYAFPAGRQVADYLETYAKRMRLPVRGETKVDGLWADADGGFLIGAGGRCFAAAEVVVATGIHQQPSVPAFTHELNSRIRQLHSSEYRNPSQLLPGDVLVVGVGHSGADIALEVASTHQTWLSGPVRGQVSLDIEARSARPLWWLLWFAAQHILTVRTPFGRRAQPTSHASGGPLVRVRLPELRAAGVRHLPARTTGVRDGLPLLADGQVANVSNVIWCTGFRHDFGWMHLPVIGEHGWPRHERGIAPVPGLYFAGLPFQYSFSSMLLGGVGRDARYIARHIAQRQRVRKPRAARLDDPGVPGHRWHVNSGAQQEE